MHRRSVIRAACAAIPLTHRHHSSAVALVTAHEYPGKPDSTLDWPALARFPGTLVFYMAVARLDARPCATSTLSIVLDARRAAPGAPVYVNAWFDWNQDGDWADGAGGSCGPEWGVQNYLVQPGALDDGIVTLELRFRAGRVPDQFWWRCVLGNVRQRPFSAIWSDPQQPMLTALRNRRPLLTGRCAQCSFLDLCNGNFRARAAALSGDAWAPDPSCYLRDDEIQAPLEVAVHG